jgi:mannose-1-phosphate guanylyltransferase/mannose-6-phosphate isomerase
VILSGGAGTRLWPLSTRVSPKQFIDLLEEPLFSATLRRLDGLAEAAPVIVVTGDDHTEVVEQALADGPVDWAAILIEPAGRNTAPAVVAAALASEPDEVLLVLPSDHLISDDEAFGAAVTRAVDHATGGSLVTFGIEPTRAETGYGYIEKGQEVDDGFRIARFKEKPGADEAKRLATDGRHLWNSGMFVFTASHFLEEAEKHAPQVVAAVRPALPPDRRGNVRLGAGFAEAPPISIDNAIMERTDDAVVVPLDAGWSDIGSWQSVWELSERNEEGNAMLGDVIALDVRGSYLRAGSRKLAIAGVEDLVVVETPEVVLIVPKEKAQMVRDLADRAGPAD